MNSCLRICSPPHGRSVTPARPVYMAYLIFIVFNAVVLATATLDLAETSGNELNIGHAMDEA